MSLPLQLDKSKSSNLIIHKTVLIELVTNSQQDLFNEMNFLHRPARKRKERDFPEKCKQIVRGAYFSAKQVLEATEYFKIFFS